MATSKTVPRRVRDAGRGKPAEVEPAELDAAVGLTVPVIEERLQVDKRALDRGGYRVTKRVEKREETVDEPLRTQDVVVERRPIGLTLEGTDIPAPRYEGDVWVVPVFEEVLVTEKRLVLVEEVRITRHQATHHEPQQVTLRKETISIERLGANDPSRPGGRNPPAPSGQGTTSPLGAVQEQTMTSVLVGMFDTQTAAERAKAQLVSAGFASSAVTMTGATGAETSSTPPTGATTSGQPHHENAIAHFFSRLFGDDEDNVDRAGYTDSYNEAFRRGSFGVTVTTADDAEMDRAERILNECGAVDIDEKTQQWKKEGWAGTTGLASDVAEPESTLQTGTTQKLQEVEEELKVGKRTVARGGIRIFTRMTEVPVEETVRLHEEHADVQRRAVDREATPADLAAFKEGSVEVRGMAEEAVISKTARVVGEVDISKKVTERDETIRDTVRKTKVDVETIETDAPGSTSSLSDEARKPL